MNSILFTMDRALQAESVVRAARKHVQGPLDIVLLAKASNDRFRSQYETLDVEIVWERNFQEDTLSLLKRDPFVWFMVDDTPPIRTINLPDILEQFEKEPLILGHLNGSGVNATWCYTFDRPQHIEVVEYLGKGLVKYNWIMSDGEAGYPLRLGDSIYRVATLWETLVTSIYNRPNFMEMAMMAKVTQFRRWKYLLCYETNRVVGLPLNVVGPINSKQSHRKEYSIEAFADLFDEGLRIDIDDLAIQAPSNASATHDVELHYV